MWWYWLWGGLSALGFVSRRWRAAVGLAFIAAARFPFLEIRAICGGLPSCEGRSGWLVTVYFIVMALMFVGGVFLAGAQHWCEEQPC